VSDQSNPYAGWRRTLAGGPLELSAGRFRHKRSGLPVAIYPDADSGQLIHRVLNQPARYVDERWEENFFSYCQAVTEDRYDNAVKGGIWWDNLRVGDNRPDSGVDALKEEALELIERGYELARRGPATTEEQANSAANLIGLIKQTREQLQTALTNEAAPFQAEIDKIERQKEPWAEKLRSVAQLFGNFLKGTADASEKIKLQVIKPYLEQKRREQQKAGQVQTLRGGGTKPVGTNVGATGNKIKLVTRWFAVVEDWDAAIEALKTNTKLRATVQEIADAAARSSAKIAIPGVKFDKEEKVQ
jgi:hypothetical protein